MLSKATEHTYKELTSKEGVVVVKFSAAWCGPCKMMAPVISELATELDGSVDFVEVDIDDCPTVSEDLGIRAVPTMIVFKGKELDRIVGAKTKAEISKWIADATSSSNP